jgi:hypothetical protein
MAQSAISFAARLAAGNRCGPPGFRHRPALGSGSAGPSTSLMIRAIQ